MHPKNLNAKIHKRFVQVFMVNDVVVDDIDEAVQRLAYVSKPLEKARFPEKYREIDVKSKKNKWKQLLLMANIHSETVRWFLMFLLSLWFPKDTEKSIFYKKLLGDFSFVVGGIPAFLHWMGALLAVVGSMYSTIFYLGEHYNQEKYLSWLDIFLVLKGKWDAKELGVSMRTKLKLLKIWKFTTPIRIYGFKFVGIEIGLCLGAVMLLGYDLSNPFDWCLLAFWIPKTLFTCHYIANTVFIFLIYCVMISEFLRNRFREVNDRVDEITKVKSKKLFLRQHVLLSKALTKFDATLYLVKQYNVVVRVINFTVYGFAVFYICLPIYHFFHVDALWIIQAALIVVGGSAAPYLFTAVFFQAKMSSTAHKLSKKLHQIYVTPMLPGLKRKTESTLSILNSGRPIGFTCLGLFTLNYGSFYEFCVMIVKYYLLTMDFVRQNV